MSAARGGARLSHTRWRMKGQRWHSLAEEWKTFSPENREATTGRGRAERPWVSLHPFGEMTCPKMQTRALVYLVVEIISCHLQKPAWNVILQWRERMHVQRVSCGSERGREEPRVLNIRKIWAGLKQRISWHLVKIQKPKEKKCFKEQSKNHISKHKN